MRDSILPFERAQQALSDDGVKIMLFCHGGIDIMKHNRTDRFSREKRRLRQWPQVFHVRSEFRRILQVNNSPPRSALFVIVINFRLTRLTYEPLAEVAGHYVPCQNG